MRVSHQLKHHLSRPLRRYKSDINNDGSEIIALMKTQGFRRDDCVAYIRGERDTIAHSIARRQYRLHRARHLDDQVDYEAQERWIEKLEEDLSRLESLSEQLLDCLSAAPASSDMESWRLREFAETQAFAQGPTELTDGDWGIFSRSQSDSRLPMLTGSLKKLHQRMAEIMAEEGGYGLIAHLIEPDSNTLLSCFQSLVEDKADRVLKELYNALYGAGAAESDYAQLYNLTKSTWQPALRAMEPALAQALLEKVQIFVSEVNEGSCTLGYGGDV